MPRLSKYGLDEDVTGDDRVFGIDSVTGKSKNFLLQSIFEAFPYAEDIVLNTEKVTDLVHPLVEVAVPLGSLFTDTIYDDTYLQNKLDLDIGNKVDKVDDHELVSTSHLIQMARMDISNFNFHMQAAIKDWKLTLATLENK
jgi:hypothetical protein